MGHTGFAVTPHTIVNVRPYSMNSVHQILSAARSLIDFEKRPVVIAIDGRSGAGKSTITDAFTKITDCSFVCLDDFYQTTVPKSDLPSKSVTERLELVFDWERVRSHAIQPLCDRRTASWNAFDFSAGLNPSGTYNLNRELTKVDPRDIVLLAGSYSCSPPLADQVDLSVLVDVPEDECRRRTTLRDCPHFLAGWHSIWDDVEDFYFSKVRPSSWFDLLVTNEWDSALVQSGPRD